MKPAEQTGVSHPETTFSRVFCVNLTLCTHFWPGTSAEQVELDVAP